MIKKKKKSHLGLEITLILAVKGLLLFSLWWLCFSHPVASHLHTTDLAQHFFNIDAI